MGSSSKPPGPSREERELQASQRQLLDVQRQQLQQQQGQQALLAPVLYETMGIRPRYDEQGVIVGYDRFETPEQALYREQVEMLRAQQPTQQRLQEQYLTLAEQQARYQAEQAPIQQRLQEQLLQYQETQLGQEQERQRLQPLLYEASGVRPVYDEAGQITAFTLTEEAQARKDYETQLLEHQRKALAGELPVDPTLERALTEGEQQLRAQLQAQLGTDYETSTPGIQALEEYRKRAAEARSTVAHGQLTSGQQLYQTQMAMNQEQMARATRGGTGLLGDYGFRPVQVQAPTSGLFQAGSPAAAAMGYQGVLSGQFGTLGEYARLAQGFGQAAGGLRQERLGEGSLEEQMRQQAMKQSGQIGTIAGGVLGGVVGSIVPGIGTAVGAGLGATLGGAAGTYYGSR